MTHEEHRSLAKKLFNRVWELMEAGSRTEQDTLEMLAAGHGSRYHWQIAGEGVQWARGEWQLSRMYAVVERAHPARFHAECCLALCEEHQLGAFDWGYAYEARARAAARAGNRRDTRKALMAAQEQAEKIEDPESRKMLTDDLATVRMAD